jgi:hypothetical protein
MAERKHRLYMISVVSEMLGIHPQTLRSMSARFYQTVAEHREYAAVF